MDTENVGHLNNSKVYSLMREQIKLQNQNVTQRKLIIGLSAFAVVLALANMGTSSELLNYGPSKSTFIHF